MTRVSKWHPTSYFSVAHRVIFFFNFLKVVEKVNRRAGDTFHGGETLPSMCEAPRFICKHHNKGKGKWWGHVLSYVKTV